MSPRKRRSGVVRLIMWGGLGAWALALGVFYVTRTVQAAPQPGERMLDARKTARSVNGGELPLLARDSMVVVLAATSECAACRTGVPEYRELQTRLKAEGVAFRVIVGSDSLAARQFSRLLPDPGAVTWDPGQKLFRGMGVLHVPSLYLVAADGRLLKGWTPVSGEPFSADAIVAQARAARRTAAR
jgi:thiol-disulfide isomerase/thioredoxin